MLSWSICYSARGANKKATVLSTRRTSGTVDVKRYGTHTHTCHRSGVNFRVFQHTLTSTTLISASSSCSCIFQSPEKSWCAYTSWSLNRKNLRYDEKQHA